MRSFWKISTTVAILVMATVVTSCGNKVNRNLDKLKKMETKYVKACSEHDFDKAHAIVEEMEPIISQTESDLEAEIAKWDAQSSRWNKSAKAKRGEARARLKTLDPICRHWEYVNNKEIYYLLAKPSKDNAARIIYLYNTYNSAQLPNMSDVLDVALNMGDEYLAEKLLIAGVSPSWKSKKIAEKSNMTRILELMEKR